MKLYMIRHGQTTCNVAGKHQGWGPVSLSEKGFEQARKAKEYVRTVNYDKIFVSDLLRTRQTAEILFPEKYRAGDVPPPRYWGGEGARESFRFSSEFW